MYIADTRNLNETEATFFIYLFFIFYLLFVFVFFLFFFFLFFFFHLRVLCFPGQA